MIHKKLQNENSSFKDPAGFVFYRKGRVYRQLNPVYAADYEHLMSSGLYDALIKQQLLIPHHESSLNFSPNGNAYKIIRPEMIPFISYPYEWGFQKLKLAALATLKIELLALNFDMSLKDASAYNVQFKGIYPVFIDTTSFEIYRPGRPWNAYRQFCQHFLAPLALMSYTDLRLNQLFRPLVDGIPLDLAVRILPFKAFLNFGLLIHIYLHSRSQVTLKSNRKIDLSKSVLKKEALISMLVSLEDTINKLQPKSAKTLWDKYYTFVNYSTSSSRYKKRLVSRFIKQVHPKLVWDLGSNTGEFSQIAAKYGAYTVAFDSDIGAVEKHFANLTGSGASLVLPLVMDLRNPSPNRGWAGSERQSLANRGPADLVMALALIHHLCIGANLPMIYIARYFGQLGKYLLIEFVPKNDSQVIEMLSSREDIFDEYTEANFLVSFKQYFQLIVSRQIPGTGRKLYLFKNRHEPEIPN